MKGKIIEIMILCSTVLKRSSANQPQRNVKRISFSSECISNLNIIFSCRHKYPRHGKVIPGFMTPDGRATDNDRGMATMGEQEVDRILYKYSGARDLPIATYRVKRPVYGGGGYFQLKEWKKCHPTQEVSDHRPRKLVLPL